MENHNMPPTPLFEAAFRLDVAEVRRLLSTGVDIDADADIRGYTCLYRVISTQREEAFEIVRVLLEAGANPNRNQGGSPRGATALGLAVANGYASIVELLLKAGADVNFAFALHIAALGRPTKSCVALIKMLIDAGGDVRLSDPGSDIGEFPLDFFEMKQEMRLTTRQSRNLPPDDEESVREMRALLAI